MHWQGQGSVWIQGTVNGNPGTPFTLGPLSAGDVVPVTVAGYTALDFTKGFATWNIFNTDPTVGSPTPIGQSRFNMTGTTTASSCFLPTGDYGTCMIGSTTVSCTNLWILEAITGNTTSLDCNAIATTGDPSDVCEVPSSGGNVSYQYTVRNFSPQPVTVQVTDDHLGTIGTQSVAPNTSVVMNKSPVSITTATLNIATAHGNTNQQGVDQCFANDVAFVVPQCFLGDPSTSPPSAYPYGTGLTATTFSESAVLKGLEPTLALENEWIKVFYSDEHALALGIKTVTGVSPFAGHNGSWPITDFDLTAAGVPLADQSKVLALSAGLAKSAAPWTRTARW